MTISRLSGLLDDRAGVDLRDANRGKNSEERRGEKADEHGEEKHRDAEMDALGTEDSCGLERWNCLDAGVGDAESEDAAHETENGRFHQKLRDEVSTRGAEGFANAQLPLTIGGAAEDEVAEIGTRNEENQTDCREEDEKIAAHLLSDVFCIDGEDIDAETRVEARILLAQIVRDSVHLDTRLLERGAGRKAGEDEHLAAIELFEIAL